MKRFRKKENSKSHKRLHGGTVSPLPHYVVNFTFIIGNAAGHLRLHLLRWQYLNAEINHAARIKQHVLDE